MSKELNRFVEIYAKFKTGIDDLYTSLEAAGYTLPEDRSFANLKAPVKEIIESGGGGGDLFTASLSEFEQVCAEMEGMPANFLRGNFTRPEFMDGTQMSIGSVVTVWEGVDTDVPVGAFGGEFTLEMFGGPAIPCAMAAAEAYSPVGGPYMCALIIAPGAYCEAFNMATGDLRFIEDADSFCIVGYCAEGDVEGNFLASPSWYFDPLKIAPYDAKGAYALGAWTMIQGTSTPQDIDEPFDLHSVMPKGETSLQQGALAFKSFNRPLTIPADITYIGDYMFYNTYLRGGLVFEKGTYADYDTFIRSGLFERAYIEGMTELDLGATSEMGFDAFRNSYISCPVKFQLHPSVQINTSYFDGAHIPSVNSDEEGTYVLSVHEGYVYLDGPCGNARKLVVNANCVVANKMSQRLFKDTNYSTTDLEELYIHMPEWHSNTDNFLYVCGGIKKLVAPNCAWQAWDCDSRATQLEYLDIYCFRGMHFNMPGTFSASSLKTLIIRSTENVEDGLDSDGIGLAYYNQCTIYVDDTMLEAYHNKYADTNIANMFKPISELPTEG